MLVDFPFLLVHNPMLFRIFASYIHQNIVSSMNKTKNFNWMYTVLMVFMAVCISGLTVACEEEEEEKSETGSESLKVTPGSLKFEAAGSTKALNVSTSYKYYGVEYNADWLSYRYDDTRDIIYITAAANSTGKGRNANLTIFGTDDSSGANIKERVTIKVEQEAASSSGNNDTQATVTVTKSQGGTVDVGDMSLDFGGNTFDDDATVTVTKVAQGSLREDEEVGDCYTVEMPIASKKPFTVSIKGANQDDVAVMAHAPSVQHGGEMKEDYSDVILQTTYKNGVYQAEVPAFENEGETGTAKFTIGLVKSDAAAKARMNTRGTTNDSKITFYLDWQKRYYKNAELALDIEGYVEEAINTILSLGFKLPDARNIPIVIKEISDEEAYGYFMQSAFSDKWSTLEINAKIVSKNDNELKQTIIHELFHYFQSAYDPRCCFSKYRNVYRDLLMLDEAGGVWIEKMIGDRKPSDILINNAKPVLNSFDPIDEVYEDAKERAKMYQSHGYGLGLVLEYLSKEAGNNAIVHLYQAVKDGATTTKEAVQRFAQKTGVDFFDNYGDFSEKAVTGQLFEQFGLSRACDMKTVDVKDDKEMTIEKDQYRYGTQVTHVRLMPAYTDAKGTKDMTKKALMGRDEKPFVVTDVYLMNQANKKGKKIGTIWKGESELSWADKAALEAAITNNMGGVNTHIYFVSRSSINTNEKSQIKFQLADAINPDFTGGKIELGFEPGNSEALPMSLQQQYLDIPMARTTDEYLNEMYFADGTTTMSNNVRTFTATGSGRTWEGTNQTYSIIVRVEAPTGWASPANYKLSGTVSWKNTINPDNPDDTETQSLSFKFNQATYMAHLSTDEFLQFALLGGNESNDNHWSECISNYSNVFNGWEYEDYTDEEGNKKQRKVPRIWTVEPPTDTFVLTVILRYEDMK